MDDEVQKSVEESLKPLYYLTHSFLNLIQPNYEDIEVLIRKLKDNFLGDSPDYLIFLKEWQLWMKHYLGPTIVISIGLVLAFILLIITVYTFLKIFCCRCVSIKSNKPPCGRKVLACRRYFFSTILIIMATIILACGICVLVINGFLNEQTTIPPNYINASLVQRQFVLPTISNSIETIKNLKDSTVEELQSHIYLNLKQKLIYIVDHIREIPIEFANQFLSSSGLSKALDLSTNFLSVVNNVTEVLQRLQDGKQKLVDQQQNLKRSLSDIKRDLLSNVPKQCRATCLQTRENINNIKINVDYNEIKDLTNVLKWMRISINDLQESISKAKELYADIVDKLKDSTDSISKEVKIKVDKLLAVVDREFTKVINIFDQVKIDDYHHYFNEHVVPQIIKFGKWRYGISFTIGLIILFWAIFSYMGICCMTCSDSSCRRRKANGMLQISFALIIIFAWCFCFVGIILFIIGSTIYFEACNAILYQQNTTVIKLADVIINDWLNETHQDISVTEIIRKKKKVPTATLR